MSKKTGKLIIVANGPSSSIYGPVNEWTMNLEEGPFFTCGVNKAVLKWSFHFWCFWDFQTFASIEPKGRPNLWVSRQTNQLLRDMQPDLVERWESYARFYHEDVKIPWSGDGGALPNRWNVYSGLSALGLAIHLNVARVVVYGADMAGTTDMADFSRAADRNPIRWARERACWNILVDYLAEQGIQVTRVVPGRIEER